MLNIGHRHPKVVEAVKAQLDKLMHTCQTVMPYEGYVKLAQKLSEVVPVKGHGKVMLANSGPNSLAGTYTGSPTACAAALAVFDVIKEEDILGKSQRLGEKLRARFDQWQEQFTHVDNARNLGPMAAFELVESKDTHKPMPELAGAIPHNGPCTVSEGLPPPTLFTSFNVTKKHTLLSSTPLLSALRVCWLIIDHCIL